MKIPSPNKGASGTTLVDVLASTFVLSVMAAGLMGCFTYGFFIMQLVRENQRATQILLEKVETIRLYSWDQVLRPGFIPASFQDVYDPQGPPGQQGITYTGAVAVVDYPYPTSYSTNLKELVVTLNWTTSRNLTRSRKLSTFIARDGLQNYVY